MTQKRTELSDWAIRRIETEFPNDVCLLVDYRAYRMDGDTSDLSFGYYVPATSRAAGLARPRIQPRARTLREDFDRPEPSGMETSACECVRSCTVSAGSVC